MNKKTPLIVTERDVYAADKENMDNTPAPDFRQSIGERSDFSDEDRGQDLAGKKNKALGDKYEFFNSEKQ